jgi:hypothetical protein
VRTRQASIAPQLRNPSGPGWQSPPAPAEPADRSPDDARRLMTALRDGSLRGRTDALNDDAWPDQAPGTGSGE